MEWIGIWRLVFFDVVNWFFGCLKDMMRVKIKKKYDSFWLLYVCVSCLIVSEY